MSDETGAVLRRARLAQQVTASQLGEMVEASLSAVTYAEQGRRPLPTRWLPLLPPEIAVPVIEAVIAEKCDELVELQDLLEEKKKVPANGGHRD